MNSGDDNNVDWFVPSIPADEKLSRLKTTTEAAADERRRQLAAADELLASTTGGLSIEDSGRDPYNSVGRQPRK
jgi:hypothetical protein